MIPKLTIVWVLALSSPIFAQEASLEPILDPVPHEIDSTDVDRPPPEPEPEAPGVGPIRSAIEAEDFETAIELIRRELHSSPTDERRAELRLLEARTLDHAGQAWDATRVYRRLLDDRFLGDQAQRELHELYVRRGQFDAADRLTLDTPDAELDDRDRLLRAYAHGVQGRYASSARLAEPLAARGDGPAEVVRGNALLALGDRDGAEATFLRVLERQRSPTVRQAAHFGLGQVARLRGARAVRALQDEKAVELGPAPWAELDLAFALRSLGRRDESRSRLEKVADGYPGLAPTAALALARLDEERGDVEEALEHLAFALRGGTGDFLAWTRAGELLIQEGEEDLGIEAYRMALAQFPNFPPARERLTRALAQRGRWEEAESDPAAADAWKLPGWTWDRLLDGDLPYFPVVADRDSVAVDDPRRTVLALVSSRAGNTGAALGWSEGADAAQPELAAVRAEALELVGRDDEAEQLWEALFVAGVNSPVVYERRARLAFGRDPELGLARFAELFEAYPRAVRARVRLAHLLVRAERYEEAAAAYREVDESAWLTPSERKRLRVERRDAEDSRSGDDGAEDGVKEDVVN